MFITPAYAQAAAPGGFDMLTSLLPFVAHFRHHVFPHPASAAAQGEGAHGDGEGVRRGDTVVTSGGLIGKVSRVIDDNEIELQLADNVKIRQLRSMISDVRAKGEPAKDDGAA